MDNSCSILDLEDARLTLMVVSSLMRVPASSYSCSACLLPRRACNTYSIESQEQRQISNTYRFVVAPDFFGFGGKSLDSPLGDAELVQGDLQLALDFVVVGLEFGELEGLLLDGLLEVDVDLVGAVQGHLQFGDLDLQLLLDAGHLGLQSGLGLDDARIELLDFDAGGLAGKEKDC